jgi:hypothetical protein
LEFLFFNLQLSICNYQFAIHRSTKENGEEEHFKLIIDNCKLQIEDRKKRKPLRGRRGIGGGVKPGGQGD